VIEETIIGKMVSHYRVLKKLGQGGMGEVYQARDTVLGRTVALKFVIFGTEREAEAQQRFLREAKAAASLDHPFICEIHQVGEVDGKTFIVMEYIDGETLAARLKQGALPIKEAVRIVLEVAEALECAHSKGIVHRDLKPGNIMLTSQGHAKVMDFGLAKQISLVGENSAGSTGSLSLTRPGAILGTPAYMSPEQAKGERIDTRSDIFSLGVILYESLTGTHPFLKSSAIETLSSILTSPVPPVRTQGIKGSSQLDQIQARALAKNPAERYQSMRDLIVDLRKLEEEASEAERRISRWKIAAALVVIAALLGITWWIAGYRSRPAQQAASHPPISVLIGDFENRTGEEVFDAVLEQALEVGLEGAPFITSYRRAGARAIAQKVQPGAERLDRNTARLVAQREGINVVLAGAIERLEGGYRMAVETIDSFSGKPMADREIRAKNKDEVLGAMAKLAVRVREVLGDTEAPSTQTIARETFTASSLEAARRYAVAQDLIASGKWRQAIDAYRSALDLDPELGRAWAGLAAASANLNRYEDAKKYYQEAMKRIDRMTERERHRTLGGYYLRTGDGQAAIKELRTLTERYPADEAGLANLAFAYFLSRDMATAVQLGRKAAEIYPKSILARGNLALYAMYAGDFDAAYAEATKVIELNPGYETAYVCKAVSELIRGHVLQAEEAYQKLAGVSVTGASLSVMGLADMALYQGKLAEGRSILELGVAGDVSGSNPNTGPKLAALAGTRLLQGKTAEAIQAAGKALAASKEPRVLFEAANVYLDAGRVNEALSLAKSLDANLEPDIQAYAHMILAKARLRQGDREGGIRGLEETQKNHDTWLGRYELGRAYLEAGKFPEAYSQLEQCLKRRGEATAVFLDDVPTTRYLPPLHYYLGRVQEGLGSPAAAESYRTFLAIKEKGGADPLLADARRRLVSY
jgi:tetratricopeptide (TPR) repeat protein/predicted Ser/Thr protein kinase